MKSYWLGFISTIAPTEFELPSSSLASATCKTGLGILSDLT